MNRRPAIAALYAAWIIAEVAFYGPHHGDFPTFYFAPKLALEDGVSLYDSGALRSAASAHGISRVCPWLYPPSKALLLRPLSWASYETARAGLYALNLALAALLPWLMFTRLGLHGGNRRLALAATLLLPFTPMLHGNLHDGNLSLLALWCALLAWGAAKKSAATEGAWLGMAAWLKLYPAIIMASALVGRRWRAPACGLALLVAIEAASLAILPADDLLAFVADIAPQGSYGETPAGIIKPWAAWNQGVGGVLSRLLVSHGPYSAIVDAPWAVKPLSYAFAFMVGVVTAMALLRRRGAATPDLDYATLLCAMFLIAPLSWSSFGMMAIPAAVVLAGSEMRRRAVPIYAMLAWLLTALPIEPLALERVFGLRAAMVLCSTQFVGVGLLWIAAVRARATS